jgi:hypothetical protein
MIHPNYVRLTVYLAFTLNQKQETGRISSLKNPREMYIPRGQNVSFCICMGSVPY